MNIVDASPALRGAVSNFLIPQMAASLQADPQVNLRDEVACIIRLGCAGFGSPSISALLPAARVRAGLERERAAVSP